MTVIEMQGYDYRAVYIPASHTAMFIEKLYADYKKFAINVVGHGMTYELGRYDNEEAADEALWRIIHAMEEERYVDLAIKNPEAG